MNKIIGTQDRLFMSIVGPSACGKTQLIFQMLEEDIFQPKFDKIIYFYQHDQPIFNQNFHLNVEFICGVDFNLIKNLPSDGTNYLLIFDDSCEEICQSREFQSIATAGRHRKLNVIYIKHNLFHKSKLGRDIELQLTHVILFKNPRDVQQIRYLARQLGESELESWYQSAVSKIFGFLLIDLSPKTNDHLRYCSGFNPTKFYLSKSKARQTKIDDLHTVRLYTKDANDFTKIFTKSGGQKFTK
jgi:hypothetical protein